MHIQSLLYSKLSPHNVPLLRGAKTTMNICLGHSQLVRTTYIDQYFSSCSQFASAVGYCRHSSPLVACPQGGRPFGDVVWKCHSHSARGEL